MKSSLKAFSALIISICFFYNGCSCGNYAEIRDGDAKLRSMKDGILMVTKKRCAQKPESFNELIQCVGNRSASAEKGYGTVYIPEFAGVNNSNTLSGSERDIAFYYDFFFRADQAGKWAFEFGVDAGIASGCSIDDKELWFESHDIYAQRDFSQAFVKEIEINKGWHHMKIYGIEGCCDGYWRLRFKSPSMKKFEIVSVKNLGVKSL